MAQSSRSGGSADDLVDKGAEQFKKVADQVEGFARCARSRTAPAK
jgi:hypothetical protein